MPRRFDYLSDIELFLASADSGSFSAAAIALGATPSMVSRGVARLEGRLGVQLMRRTTRSLSLTDAGRAYLEQARAAFSLLEEAERDVQGDAAHLRGRVRLSVSTTYGHYRLPAMLAAFARRHPDVQIEVSIANRNVDLIAEGFDLAIRLGDLPDSGLRARRLEDASVCLVAAPDYLGRVGAPRSLEDLADHACIGFVMPSTGRIGNWLFRRDDRDIDWAPEGQWTVSEDVLGAVSLVESGLGVCQTYDFVAAEALAAGRLIEVLPELRGRSRPFSLLHAPHRRLSAPVRTLIDHLVEAAKDARNANG